MADEHGKFGGNADLSWCLNRSRSRQGLLVLAHGAGAGMDHANMTALALAVAHVGFDVFRFNFPFTQAGRKRVDSKSVSTATIEAAVSHAQMLSPGGQLLLGGHSFGGRMASHAYSSTNWA
ncbi:MAG: alpha/beta fold hydrolase [Gammaproteobacteria bacterium]|nr:alpha/beta fold hydrolase [Gammaproteobacteria bacterium]